MSLLDAVATSIPTEKTLPSTTEPEETSSTWSTGEMRKETPTLSSGRSVLNSMHSKSSSSLSENYDFRESMWAAPHFYGFVDGLVL
jgi:hypothetical protein